MHSMNKKTLIMNSTVHVLLKNIYKLQHCTKLSSKLMNLCEMTLFLQIVMELRTYFLRVSFKKLHSPLESPMGGGTLDMSSARNETLPIKYTYLCIYIYIYIYIYINTVINRAVEQIWIF